MYNVKSIVYPNGDIQVRRYSKALVQREKNEYEENDNLEISPFDGRLVRVVDDFDKVRQKKHHASEEENRTRSFNRTKQKIYEYARCTKWEKFITLTFNQEKVDRYDFDECSRIARKWLNNQRRNAPDLQYLLVPEFHKDGAIHFHGLLARTGNMKFVDSGKRTKEKQTIYNMSAWKNGFTTAIDVYNTHGVAKYIGKYITKELCELSKGKQRYFVSSNLDEPEKTTFLVENDEDFNDLLQTLANSYGVKIVHESKPRCLGAFVDVDYYELQ